MDQIEIQNFSSWEAHRALVAYVATGEGQDISARYERAFERDDAAFQTFAFFFDLIAVPALLIVLLVLPDAGSPIAKVSGLLSFMWVVFYLVARVPSIFCRVVPYRVRLWWYRDLPPEAAKYRDLAIAADR